MPELSDRERKLKLLKLKELEEQEEQLRLKVSHYQENNRVEFVQFLPHQQKIIDFLEKGKKIVLMVTGNRGGKTTLGAIITALICVPELRRKKGYDWFDKVFPVKGCRIRILNRDWEHHAGQVIVPALKEWIPTGTYETKKNNVGIDAFWYFPKSKASIELMTNSQETSIHEGWKGHFVWQDETTTRDKYVANKRGLIDYSGVYLMTFTAVDTSWVLDDIVLSQDENIGCLTGVSTYENTFLKPEDIKAYEVTLTDVEKTARIGGNFINLEGRIWKVFDKDVHVINDFKIPPDWPVSFQVDFHLNLPHAISYCSVDRYGRFFICGETWENMTSESIADEIIRKKQAGWRIMEGEIDALSKGDTSYVKNRIGEVQDSFTIIRDKLSRYQINLGVGSKDEKSYINAVDGMFRGVNGPPLLYIFKSCTETIKQIDRWCYDENGKPKSDGHFPECIGRFTQMGLKYIPLGGQLYDKLIQNAPKEVQRGAGY